MLEGKPVLSESKAKWLFCYGTLRYNSFYEQLTQAAAPPSVPATLQGWTQFKVPGTEYPGAVPSRFSDAVRGELRPIKAESTWEILDAYEGTEYLRVPCIVQTAQGSIEAQIYRYDLEHRHRIEELADHTEWQRTISDWLIDCGSTAAQNDGCKDIPRVFVSLINEAPVGSVRLETHRVPGFAKSTPRIAGLYVIRELRHLGLGTMLVEGTVEKARQLGLRELYLYAKDRHQFFVHLGWRTLRAVRLEDRDVNLMHRLI